MVIIYVGKKVPEYYEEVAGSIHLGKGVWMLSCELKPDWQIIMKKKNKNKKPVKPSKLITYNYKLGDDVKKIKPNKVQKFLEKLQDSTETNNSDEFIKQMLKTQKRKPNKKEKKIIEAIK